MSLIRQIQELGSPEVMAEVASCYQNMFPMQIRIIFADFLETRLVNVPLCTDQNDQFLSQAIAFLNDFVNEINRKGMEMSREAGQEYFDLANRLSGMNANDTYSYLIQCINYEQYLIRNDPRNFGSEIASIVARCCEIEKNKTQWDQQFQTYLDENNEINFEMSQLSQANCPNSQEILLNLRKESQTMSLNQLTVDLRIIFAEISTSTDSLENSINKLISDYLKNWRWNQKLYGKDLPVYGATLNTMQTWCEQLLNVITRTSFINNYFMEYRDQLANHQLIENSQHFDNINQKLQESMRFLVKNSFLVEEQPPQILKANTKFSAKVRLLIGNAIDLKNQKPIVKVFLANEPQALMTQQNVIPEKFCGKIMNDQKFFERNEGTYEVTAYFQQMKLDGFERAPKKATESVTDEKFALMFQSTFRISNMDFQVNELSLPVVITVHGIQETHAGATIFWDNAFSAIDRNPFIVPHQVTWKQFSEALDQKFTLELNRGLTQEQLHFFAEKMFNTIVPYPVPQETIVSWTVFCKQPMANFNFTFWDWLYGAMKFLKDQMQRIWEDGYFYGFMRKEKIEEALKATGTPGVFTLRFPDSSPGSISVACLSINDLSYVGHLQPVGANDFGSHSLMDLLNKVEGLRILYPNLPIEEASQRFARAAGANRQADNRVDGNYLPFRMRLFPNSRS